VEAHRLLAGPKPTGKPTGVQLSQPQVQADDQQEARLAITHYKKGFTLYIYSTFEKASFMPEFQRSASGL